MTKLQEFQTLKSVGIITIPFSIEWSPDNFISYVTDKGVNIVELRLSGLNSEEGINLKRWFIKPSQAVPTNECEIDVPKLSDSLIPEELFKLVLDSTLSPRASLNGSTANTLAASWSPLCHPLFESSLLTVLTDQGSLDLYRYGTTAWIHLGSVTESWLNICNKEWDNSKLDYSSTSYMLSELKRRTYRVKLTSFAWGKCHNKKWLSLFTGNKIGEIIFWKIEAVNSDITVTKLLVFNTDLNSICSLNCLCLGDESFMLLLGCISGRIQCLAIDKCSLKAKSMVWSDLDQLQIPLNGTVAALLPQGILYAVPKLGHLLFFWLDSDANLINFALHSTDDICISGIVWLKGNEFLVCTRNGTLFNVKVGLSSNALEVDIEKWEPVTKNCFSYHGIVASKNNLIFAIPCSVCTPYDYSTLKEPTTVGLFNLLPDRCDPDTLLRTYSDSLHDDLDSLEIIRLKCVHKKERVPFTIDLNDIYDTMDITKMKKLYWLNKLSLSVTEETTKIYKELESLCYELKRAIISFYLFSRITDLISKKDISPAEKESLVCSKIWFRQYSKDGMLKSYQLKSKILLDGLELFDLNEQETCPFCDSVCEPVSVDLMMKCPSGHRTSKCSRTLLPVLAPPYYTCNFCGEISAYGLNEYSCIMCDSPLRTDTTLLRAEDDN